MKINKLKLFISMVIILFFSCGFFHYLGKCFEDTTNKDFEEDEGINVELETKKPSIAENLQKSAENCSNIEDFCDVLEEKNIFPVSDDISRDSLIIYFKYTFKDNSILIISTNRTSRKIIGVKVVE